MITDVQGERLTAADKARLARKEMARGLWAEGRTDDALLVLRSVDRSQMSPRVLGEFLITEAAFLGERDDLDGSEELLNLAAPLVDSTPPRVRASFHFQRGRVRKNAGEVDLALTDYAGAAAWFEAVGETDRADISLLNVAELYLTLGDTDSARVNLDKAMNAIRDSNSSYAPQAYDTEAKILLAEGKPGSALDAINSALATASDHSNWRAEFEKTKERIESDLLEALGVRTLKDCDRLKVKVTSTALRKSQGNLTAAGRIVGATHHAISYIVDQNKELEPYRVKRRVRRRSFIKKS